MTFSRAAFSTLVAQRVAGIGNATHYVGRIPQTPPAVGPEDLRVLPYTVLWMSPGANGDEQALAGGIQDDTVARFIITCASGDPDWTLKLVDLVDGLFNGWEPIIAGLSVGTCVQDFDPGPIQPSDSFAPTRYYLQMPYRMQAGS